MFTQFIDSLKGLDWSWPSLVKVGFVSVIAVFIISVLGNGLTSHSIGGYDTSSVMSLVAPSSAPMPSYKMEAYGDLGYGGGVAAGVAEYAPTYAQQISFPQMPQMPQMPQVNGSRNSEKYEQVGYVASYETRNIQKFCGEIESLKPLEYVLFDSASQTEYNCYYSFRVEKSKTDEIVVRLKALDPKDWSVSVNTVAQGIENTEDQIATLKTRLSSLNDTLMQAESAYNKLVVMATQSGKVGDLASILTSKLSTIERLTNDKLNLEDQIKQLSGGKDDIMDQTAYTQFSVSVQKVTIIDWQRLRDEWKNAMQQTVEDISRTLTWIIFSLPSFLLLLVWYGLVIAILAVAVTFFARHLFAVVKRVWNG